MTLFVVLGLVGLLGAGCGDDDDDDAGGSPATETTAADDGGGEEATLTIADFEFSDLTVAPGTEVTVVNEDDAPHTATADDDSFDSGNIDGGAEGSFTAPDEPGEYAYHCDVHPDMKATLTVE
jgi:plastocyanin